MYGAPVLQPGPYRSARTECQTCLVLHQYVQGDELSQQCTEQGHHNQLTNFNQEGEHVDSHWILTSIRTRFAICEHNDNDRLMYRVPGFDEG